MAGILSPEQRKALCASRLFAALSPEECEQVLPCFRPLHLARGTILCSEGERGAEMFVFLWGKLSAVVRGAGDTRRRLFEISHGDFLGEMSVIAKKPRSATITAAADSVLAALSADDFFRIIADLPDAGVKMLRAITRVQGDWLDESSRQLSDLTRWGETARKRALTDELTGLYNRRFLEDSVRSRFEAGLAGPRQMSLLMMDLDHIHEVNERYGIRAGDLCFVYTANAIRSCTRPGDICARLSGDEFAIFLPDAGNGEALAIAERIRAAVAAGRVEAPEKSRTVKIKIRASIGVACAPAPAHTRAELFTLSDEALRYAKAQGRNRVVEAAPA
ncbi:MAG: GGDEF domain-containing protein [Treponema sp.]|jgi:diguanylate cyclase (GGDEF)-like protein|nr:GGDEF domain-containing protein [Treponema sp.]